MDLDSGAADSLVADLRGPAGPVRVHVWPALAPGARDAGNPARHVRRRRDESGRPVLVAFHGWTDDGGVFGPLAEALGRTWTVIAPDAPGHGGTPWPGGAEFRLDDQAAGGLAVIDALPSMAGRHAPVVALGHSVGAIAATAVSAARPRAVRHLVLEDPVGTTLRAARSQARRRRRVAALQELDDAGRAELARREHPDWPEDELHPWARAKARVDPEHLRVPATWGAPLAARLADVRCPVTIIRGDPQRGGLVSTAAARRVAAACRGGCEVVSLAAGHNVRREARAPFVAALAAVLGRYEP